MSKSKQLRTVNEVGNQFGYLCPSCGCGDRLVVAAWTSLLLTREGTETTDSGHEWDQDCPVSCRRCNWRGQVHELEEVELTYEDACTCAERSRYGSQPDSACPLAGRPRKNRCPACGHPIALCICQRV